MARLLLLATIWAPCQLLTLPVLPQPHTNAHIILRSVLRVGVPVAEGHENEHDSLAMARSTEHALRAFCALNGVVALRCAGLHTTVAWQLVAKARELRDMTRANGGAARPAVAERFTLGDGRSQRRRRVVGARGSETAQWVYQLHGSRLRSRA